MITADHRVLETLGQTRMKYFIFGFDKLAWRGNSCVSTSSLGGVAQAAPWTPPAARCAGAGSSESSGDPDIRGKTSDCRPGSAPRDDDSAFYRPGSCQGSHTCGYYNSPWQRAGSDAGIKTRVEGSCPKTHFGCRAGTTAAVF